MLKKNPSHHQNSLFSSLSDLPDQRHLLYRLADKINWDTFEQSFSALYSSNKEHKKYEFGNRVSVITSIRGVIFGSTFFQK